MRVLMAGLILVVGSASHGGEAALTAKERAAARKIYVAKCAKCHRFYEPKDYSEPEWQLWMEKMNKKSKLKENQAALLKRYLDAYRAGQLPGKPENKGL